MMRLYRGGYRTLSHQSQLALPSPPALNGEGPEEPTKQLQLQGEASQGPACHQEVSFCFLMGQVVSSLASGSGCPWALFLP